MKQALPLLTIAIALLLGLYVYNQRNTPLPQNPQTTPEITPAPTVDTTGAIEGSLSFPSETIPENLEVCAEPIATGSAQLFCTDEHIPSTKYTYRVGYKLEKVPEGKYFVYASIPGDERKAYYSEFVTCGLKAECESHEPLEVEVKPGVTTQNIDPQDWYVLP